MARSCQSHCRACGQHFATDDAFDAHRRFAEGHEGDWDHRTCLDAIDSEGFELVDGDGVCDIAGGPADLHVRVWRFAAIASEAA